MSFVLNLTSVDVQYGSRADAVTWNDVMAAMLADSVSRCPFTWRIILPNYSHVSLKGHWHLHDFCSRNGTLCVVAMRAILVVRCVAWSGVCVLFAYCGRNSYAQFTQCAKEMTTIDTQWNGFFTHTSCYLCASSARKARTSDSVG